MQRLADITQQLQPQKGNDLMRRPAQVSRQGAADDDGFDLPRQPHPTHKRQPVHTLHLQIADGDIHRPHLLKYRQRLATVSGLKHLMTAQRTKQAHRHGTLKAVIFKNQDTQGVARH